MNIFYQEHGDAYDVFLYQLPPLKLLLGAFQYRQNHIAIPTSMYSHASGIKTLSGSNFFEWYEQIQFTLGDMDLDLALLTEKPGEITDANSEKEVSLIEAWTKFNRLSLMLIRMTVANNIKTSLPEVDNAMELLTAIKERFKSADKSLAGTLMAELTTMKYGGDKGIQEHS
ncbi:PREDICTED: uncharacterized protein LOC105961831 [Erythranthe guttata]|uniref:uncharacterized protein LOC105961831 n=1 Tax=Erythranthe guttata TaxID=4155 RepID=UPI00064DAF45|nr:PREDICTED: uncharacterized protein LOC105961831 [Erythranthe guttata]|eukprot:XP_012841550.1 PREDICTED: uncharacterized protein LOC105961831 [Erythranthe guttata]